ncbi:ABC transporter permease [Blautia schinkii]|nr:ABC transporter permease [Blautia schinkii]
MQEKAKSNSGIRAKIKWLLSYQEMVVALVIIAISIYLTCVRPDSFPTTMNIFNVFRQASHYAVLAVGMGFVIITGGVDLSVGAVIACSICVATYANASAGGSLNPFLVLLIILAVGLVFGIFNGILVAQIGLPPFIATMGVLKIGNGIALLVSNGSPIKYGESWISVFGGKYIGPVPVSVIFMAVIVLLGWIFAQYTVLGRNVYAVGCNVRAAKLSGINTERVTMFVYALSGVMSACVGLLMLGQLKQAGPSYGEGYELDAIAACVIGGISMAGGEGNIFGVVLGAALMSLLKNLFVQVAVPGYWQTVVLGIVIIFSVAIDCFRKKREAR